MTSLLEYDRLFFSQKTKIIELTNEFKIMDESGADVGSIKQEGQSMLKKAARLVSSLDQFMTHSLSVYDQAGQRVLELTRPRKFIKSKLIVTDGNGRDVGKIVQKNAIGKIRFGLEGSNGENLGEIKAENWRAWNFAIVDPGEREVGRITKKWEGLLKTSFTTADNYMLDITPEATGDLRLLMLASAAGVDTALKQDSRGFN